MTFPLKALTRLLAPESSEIGSVVAIEGSVIRVATARGAVLARTVDALVVGDRVQVRHGMATKSPVARQIYPV
jgi:hypothetical protein